jgi:hypothetical protein
MRTNIINESIARELVGQQFMGGRFVSYETRNGKTTMTAECSQCGGPHSQISVTNAAQAAKNPTVHLIGCQWPNCKFVVPTAKKETLEDVLAIPEARRSSAQQRLVIEAEHDQRNAQRAAVKQTSITAAQAATNKAIKSALWEQRERYLQTLAHTEGVQLISNPKVLNSPAYETWEQWQTMASERPEQLLATNEAVDLYFKAFGLR